MQRIQRNVQLPSLTLQLFNQSLLIGALTKVTTNLRCNLSASGNNYQAAAGLSPI